MSRKRKTAKERGKKNKKRKKKKKKKKKKRREINCYLDRYLRSNDILKNLRQRVDISS